MATPGPFHATLGRAWRDHREPVTCSKCGANIDDDDVPLELYSAESNLVWTYCDDCGEAIVRELMARRRDDKKSN